MKRKRFFMGPVKNPTWKDFVVRVGGASAVVAAGILASREFMPGYEGITAIVISVALIAFVGVQEWRQQKARREESRR
jgi:hypothetical protein